MVGVSSVVQCVCNLINGGEQCCHLDPFKAINCHFKATIKPSLSIRDYDGHQGIPAITFPGDIWQVSQAINYLTTVVIQSLALFAAAFLCCLAASMYIHHPPPVCLLLWLTRIYSYL